MIVCLSLMAIYWVFTKRHHFSLLLNASHFYKNNNPYSILIGNITMGNPNLKSLFWMENKVWLCSN